MSGPLDALTEAITGQNLWHTRHATSPAGKATASAIIDGLARRGYRIVSDAAWRDVNAAAQVALTPTGEHRLIDGYCPDCGGGCLRDWAQTEVTSYVEPTPIEVKP